MAEVENKWRRGLDFFPNLDIIPFILSLSPFNNLTATSPLLADGRGSLSLHHTLCTHILYSVFLCNDLEIDVGRHPIRWLPSLEG